MLQDLTITKGDDEMNFFDLVQKRESCRDYADQKVEKEKLVSCIEAARLSPSACNSQPWSFIVINQDELSQKVAKCTQNLGMNKFTDRCPAFIVVCQESANTTAKIGGVVTNQQFAPIDIGLAAAHICYRATELGLSTCILGWFSEKKLKELLSLPGSKHIRLILAVGYANSDQIRAKKRKSLDDIMTYIG